MTSRSFLSALCRLAALITLSVGGLSLLLIGCGGYTSAYVNQRRDGRARPTFRGHDVRVDLSNIQLSSECQKQIDAFMATERQKSVGSMGPAYELSSELALRTVAGGSSQGLGNPFGVAVLMPLVPLSMLLLNPEHEDASASAIELINLYNSLARTHASPCGLGDPP